MYVFNHSGEKKHHDKLAKRMPGVHSPQPSPQPSVGRTSQGRGEGRGQRRDDSQGRSQGQPLAAADTGSVSSLPVSESEDDLNGEWLTCRHTGYIRGGRYRRGIT